jgi:hypothetical protein
MPAIPPPALLRRSLDGLTLDCNDDADGDDFPEMPREDSNIIESPVRGNEG